MSNYDAILFDVDGTLIDSAPGIRESFAHTFRTMGINDSGIDYGQFLGPPLRESFAKYTANDAETERAVEIYRVYYKKAGQHRCCLYPGAREMLQTLCGNGFVLGTATSKPTEVVLPILERLQIRELFRVVGGASMDQSIDTKTAVIQMALRQPPLQKKKVLMVGDRRDDLLGAKDCGIPAVGVLYGYGSRGELQEHAPAFLAHNCKELTQYILSTKGD